MIESRRKLLAEKGLGEKWTPIKGLLPLPDGTWIGKEDFNHTFADPDDYEALREKVVLPHLNKFTAYVWSGMDDGERQQDAFAYWLTLSVEERNELICDFGVEVLGWEVEK